MKSSDRSIRPEKRTRWPILCGQVADSVAGETRAATVVVEVDAASLETGTGGGSGGELMRGGAGGELMRGGGAAFSS